MHFKRKHMVSQYDRKRNSCKPAIALMLGFALLINSPLSTLASETNEVITAETVLQNDMNMKSSSDAAFNGSGADTQLCDTDASLNINDFSLEAETSGSDIIIETEDSNIETVESSSEMISGTGERELDAEAADSYPDAIQSTDVSDIQSDIDDTYEYEIALDIDTVPATECVSSDVCRNESPNFSEKAKIVSIIDTDYLQNIPAVTIIQNTAQNNQPLLDMIMHLLNVTAISQLPDGTTETVTLSVDWNVGNFYTPQIDVSVPGSYEEHGCILLPDGYEFADNVLQEIIIPVEVIVPPEPIVITSIETFPELADAYAFPLGTSITEIIASCSLENYWNCYDASGTLYITNIYWDFSNIAPMTAGLYEIIGQIQPPEHTVFAETLNVEKIMIPISIQEPGKPDINCCYAGRGRFIFPWITPPGSLDEIKVWISEENSAWNSYSRDDPQVYWDAYTLILDASLFTAGKSYRLQVDYDGGSTQILAFTYNQHPHIHSYNEGDRDGGDANGYPSGNTTQTTPETPAQSDADSEPGSESEPLSESDSETSQTGSDSYSNVETSGNDGLNEDKTDNTSQTAPGSPAQSDAEPETEPGSGSKSVLEPSQNAPNADSNVKTPSSSGKILEFSGEDYDMISGKRLLMMLDASGIAQFSKHGISVILSRSAVLSTVPSDHDQFCITILNNSDHSFSFSVTQNDMPIENLVNTKLMLPWEPHSSSSIPFLLNENYTLAAIGTYAPDASIATFTVNTSGNYIIYEASELTEAIRILLLTVFSMFLNTII